MTVIDTPGTATSISGWTQACRLDYLIPGRGVAVLLKGGRQAALFLTTDGTLYAVGNIDPFGRAAVMSRGLVGDRGGVPVVASPLLKQAFSLIDGSCLDDGSISLPVYAVRVVDGVVAVSNDPVQFPGGPA
ncbi:nitrite reductase small subunit NirD [Nocardia seriolae]|uniref:Nitrite reductase n=1 Tax=Nocardia seriolae TaxID=37332 RepID=A0ABC8APX0_9NOCA|nr:nitrite reductase small subunit NirD [Nocardia seriolae]APA96211.1 Nitrite reductase (NADH) [Nocardia seriolae]OJF82452.1 nitrite reductase small subunit [Nocardia seriolae]PSK30825.1 nitrite reductase (NAD(P)H) small subunit [Nocardia seriolae]QOW33204.1 nitrite reductase small subunit NirD [Nocardia seriolae]QUN21048.1 nitrite reductase small subunit NirD [Nocardia seriolae]